MQQASQSKCKLSWYINGELTEFGASNLYCKHKILLRPPEAYFKKKEFQSDEWADLNAFCLLQYWLQA